LTTPALKPGSSTADCSNTKKNPADKLTALFVADRSGCTIRDNLTGKGMQRPFWSRRFSGWPASAALLLSAVSAHAQLLIQGSGPAHNVNIFNTDLAVLESGEQRKDLPCSVTPGKPTLGFDLRYHAGYQVTIPLKELEGGESNLNVLFRVVPAGRPDDPVFFSQHIHVPPIEDDAKGDAYLQGAFDVGVGEYHVDWLMRDRTERVCSSSWDAEASLAPKDRSINLDIPPGSV